jgi:hypothetical protein
VGHRVLTGSIGGMGHWVQGHKLHTRDRDEGPNKAFSHH